MKILKVFEEFESNFKTLERDLKHSNANSNDWKWIRSFQMQIPNIRKFETFERDSNHSNANSNHSKGIGSIQMQIRTIRKGSELF